MEALLYLIASVGAFWALACVLAKRSKLVAVLCSLAGSASAVCSVGYAMGQLPQPQGVLVAAGLWAVFGLAYKRTAAQVG